MPPASLRVGQNGCFRADFVKARECKAGKRRKRFVYADAVNCKANFRKENRMRFSEQDLLRDSAHLSDDQKKVVIIDQTRLPNEEVFLEITELEDMYCAIKTLAVRGAPMIGIFAAYGFYVRALENEGLEKSAFISRMEEEGAYLVSSRPTAVNLSWAVREMLAEMKRHETEPAADIVEALRLRSLAIHKENTEMSYRIAEYGLTLVKDGDGILTHCNAGPLACGAYGTATAPVFLGRERGINFKVYSDETRPLLQGARLTSYELHKAGIDVTLICDNMASMVMKNGWVQAVFVGCDRIAANGDFANKIGTSGVAILAKHYGIPFYTLGPASTVDMNCRSGEDIRIELRDQNEIRTMWYEKPMALEGVKCFNPSFDVTDHSLLTAIVTDRGIVYPPFDVNLKKLFG